jgi:hypothetical protein
VEVEQTKAGIEAALTRWASLRRKKGRLEGAQAKELTPLREAYESASAPILAKHAPGLTAVEEEVSQCEAAIRDAVLNAKGKDGSHKFPRLTSGKVVAELHTSSRRELSPQTFFELVPQAERESKFWGCLSVLIGKAEKLLGAARLDEHAKPKVTHSVTVKEL